MKAVTTRLNAARKKLKEAMFMLKVRPEAAWREVEEELKGLILRTEDMMLKLGEVEGRTMRRLNLVRPPKRKEREDLVTKMIARKHTSRTVTEKRRTGQR